MKTLNETQKYLLKSKSLRESGCSSQTISWSHSENTTERLCLVVKSLISPLQDVRGEATVRGRVGPAAGH